MSLKDTSLPHWRLTFGHVLDLGWSLSSCVYHPVFLNTSELQASGCFPRSLEPCHWRAGLFCVGVTACWRVQPWH